MDDTWVKVRPVLLHRPCHAGIGLPSRSASGRLPYGRVRTSADVRDVRGRRPVLQLGVRVAGDVAWPAEDEPSTVRAIEERLNQRVRYSGDWSSFGWHLAPDAWTERFWGLTGDRVLRADGTRAHVLTPLEFIARLAAIVPRPRRHLLHLHGVFAPAARLRARVVPAPPPAPERQPLLPPSVLVPRDSRWIPWSDLLWRVFEADGRACHTCGRPMTVHAVVQGVWATRRVLASLAHPSAAPRLLPARGPPAATA